MSSEALPLQPSDIAKKRRRPAGTPDPDAEVVSLPPQTLLESDRYICEICKQGFQREQNLQMHRRRHKVPWRLLKKEKEKETATGGEVANKKRVYVCPEPSCLHHDPGHALGDLVGIKKHFRRKHSDRRQWVCGRCDKGYAVQSDYKAHLKTCGTRGHTCDCGRVFSRVESFIEHQDTCVAHGSYSQRSACLSRTGSSSSPSTDTDSNMAAPPNASTWPSLSISTTIASPKLELQLLPAFTSKPASTTTTTTTTTGTPPSTDEAAATTQLQLSLASSGSRTGGNVDQLQSQLRVAADEARRQARRELELAQQDFANAVRTRQQAQAELDKAYVLRNNAAKSIDSMLFQVTCHECKKRLQIPRDVCGERRREE